MRPIYSFCLMEQLNDGAFKVINEKQSNELWKNVSKFRGIMRKLLNFAILDIDWCDNKHCYEIHLTKKIGTQKITSKKIQK